MATYRLLNSLVPMFEQKLNKFANKFEKFGAGTFTYTKSEPYCIKEKKDKFFNQLVVDIEVEGSYVISNYEFIASLEWIDKKGTNLVKKIDDKYQVPEKYVHSTHCEHCGYARFRRYTVILRNTETGEFIQVGKTCVKDFLGCDIGKYASYLSVWSSLEDYAESLNEDNLSGRKDTVFDPDDILLQTIEEVKHHGYISKKQVWASESCELNTTASTVFGIMNEVRGRYGELLYPAHKIVDEDYEVLAKIKEFIEGLDSDNDYNRNIQMLTSMGYTTNANLGLVVSAVGFYLRKTSEKAEKSEQKVASEYVGEIGKRIQVTARPVCIFSADGEFGWRYIYKFVENNNVFVWSTSKELGTETEITIKGTVKQHKEYGRVKETVLTNCRVGG